MKRTIFIGVMIFVASLIGVIRQNVQAATSLRDAVVFIPGIEGSRLYESLSSGPEAIALKRWEPETPFDLESLYLGNLGTSSNKIATMPGDIINKTNIAGYEGTAIYDGITQQLQTLKGNGTIADWKVLQYDWRLSQKLIATGDNKILRWQVNLYYQEVYRMADTVIALADQKNVNQVSLVTHSNGGIVAKFLIDELNRRGRGDTVNKLIMVAAPQLGTPKGLSVLLHGESDYIFPKSILISNGDTRAIAENAPGAYTFLPSKKYFEVSPSNMVVFDDSLFNKSTTKDWQTAYGQLIGKNRVITTQSEMTSFFASLRDNRFDPAKDDVTDPNIANTYLLSDGLKLQDELDAWTAPATIKVHQIVGTGLDTISGVLYYNTSDEYSGTPKLNASDLYSPDGDGTVMSKSASYLSSPTYYVDLKSYNLATSKAYDHSNIMSSSPVLSLISGILSGQISGPGSSLPSYVSGADTFVPPVQPPLQPEANIYDRPVIAASKDSLYVSSQVDSHSLATKFYYQYGINNLGEAITATYPLNTYSPDNNASVVITGLNCGTTYHYRILVTNSAGAVLGSDRTTSTLPCDPTPLGSFTLSSPQILYCDASIAQNKLTWTSSANAQGYYILRNGTQVGTALAIDTSYTDNSPSGSTSSYIVRAYNGSTTLDSNSVNIDTSSYCQTAIGDHTPKIATKAADSITTNNARLNGEVNPNGNSTNVWYEYGTTQSLGSTTNSKNYGGGYDISSTPFNISVSCGTVYYFRAVAQNAYATVNGTTLTFITSQCSVEAPSNLTGSVTNANALTLNWQDNSAIEEDMLVQRNYNGSSYNNYVWLNPNITTWGESTANYVAGNYCFQIRAYAQQQGLSSPSNSLCFDLPVATPTPTATATPTPTPTATPTPTPTPTKTPTPTPTPTKTPTPTPTVTPTPGPIVFQPGPEGKDMWWSSLYDYGSNHIVDDTKLQVGGWGDNYWTFLQFDLSTLPATATKVQLMLYDYSSNGGSPVSMNLYPLNTVWSEKTGWSGSLSLGTASAIPAPTVGKWITIDITTLYNDWKAGRRTNNGIVFKPTAVKNNFDYFYSSDYTGDTTLRPKLVITK